MAEAASAAGAGVGSPPPMTPKDAELLHAFNAQFHLNATDIKVVKRLLGPGKVLDWYRGWRAERATENALPDPWREAGMTPTEWAPIQPILASRRHLRAEADREIAQAVEALQERLRIISGALQMNLSPTAEPLVKIVEAGYPQLSLDSDIAIETSSNRDAALAAELTAARAQWLAIARAGCDPLPFWAGKLSTANFLEVELPSEYGDGDANLLSR